MALKISEFLTLKENTYYEIDVYNSFNGKILSIIDHSPSLNIYISNDNETIKFRTSKSLLKSGIFKSKIIKNTNDYSSLFGTLQNNNYSNTIQISPENVDLFVEKIKITEYKITQ